MNSKNVPPLEGGLPQPNFNEPNEKQQGLPSLPQPPSTTQSSSHLTQPVVNNTPNQNVNSHIQQPNQNNSPVTKEYPPRYSFYTAKSALSINLTRNNDAIIVQLANAIAQRKYDWQNGIAVKLGIDEVDNIIYVLESYLKGGANYFAQVAQFLQNKNQQKGTLNFYHNSPKGGNAIINVMISKAGIPMVAVTKNDSKGNRNVIFPILPSVIRTFIRVFNRFADIVISQPVRVNK